MENAKYRWASIQRDRLFPTNPLKIPLGGVIVIEKNILSKEFCTKMYNDLFIDETYDSLLTKDELLARRVRLIQGLYEKEGSGFRFVHPAFHNPFTAVGILFHNPPFDTWFNYDRLKYDILAFRMQSYDIRLTNRDQVYWFMDLMKKVFLYLDAEYCWCDHFDYLYKHRNHDAREYLFGLNFYGREMVEKIGKEKLLTAPVYKVEELDNGSIMLQLHEHPFCKIPESERKPILKHLGIKRKRKAKPPVWVKTRAPGRIKLEMKAYTNLVVGLNASKVMLKGRGESLFAFYCENVHPKLGNAEETPCAVGFKHWFDNLEMGLRGFASGSDESGETGGDYKAFIGLPVDKPRDVFSGKPEDGKLIPVHQLPLEKVGSVSREVRERLTTLGSKEEPQLWSLLYLYQGELE
jgi:hypothetical protein